MLKLVLTVLGDEPLYDLYPMLETRWSLASLSISYQLFQQRRAYVWAF